MEPYGRLPDASGQCHGESRDSIDPGRPGPNSRWTGGKKSGKWCETVGTVVVAVLGVFEEFFVVLKIQNEEQ